MIKVFNLNDIKINDNDIVIVPRKKEMYYKLKYVSKNYNITTLKNLILDLYDKNKKMVSSYEAYLFMRDSKNKVNNKLKKYNSFDSYDFINELLNSYESFNNFDLNDNDKISDLKIIYEEYEKQLLENNFINEKLMIDYLIKNKSFLNHYIFLDIDKIEDNYERVYAYILDNCNCDFYIDKRYNNSLINLLNKYGCDIKFQDKKEENALFKTANDIEDETNFVINDITKKIYDGALLKDFLVIAKDINKYEPYFNLKLKFPYSKTNTSGILTARFIKIASKIFNGDFSSKNFMSLLKLRLLDTDELKIDKLENYIYSWSLEDYPFYKPFTYNPSGNKNDFSNNDLINLKEINDIKNSIINPIMHLLENVNGIDDKETILKEFYTYLDEEKIIDKLYEYDLDGVKKLNNALDTIFNVLEGKTTLTDIINILNSFDYKTIKKEANKDEITLSNLSVYNLADKKYIYLVGLCNEDIPGYVKLNTLIKKEDIKEDSLINYINKNSLDSLYDFNNIISKNCTASYHKLSTELKLNTKSTYLKNINLKECETDIYDPDLLKLNYAYDLSNDLVNVCNNDKLKQINKSNKHDLNYKIDYGSAKKLYTNFLDVSPSSIEVYAKCPFYHFCNYGLKLKVKEKYLFDNREVGTFVHFILENILKNDFDKVTYDNVEKYVYKYSKNYLEKNGKVVNNKTKFIIERLSKSTSIIIKNIIDEMDVINFKPKFFEFKIGESGVIKPAVINLEKGTLKISGIIDRVDVYETDDEYYYRIVDYKTGAKKFKLQDVLVGLNLQMLLYLIAIKKSNLNKNIIPSALLYYPALVKENKISRCMTEDEISSQIKKSLKMNGLINKDTSVIKNMGDMDSISAFADVISREKLNPDKVFDSSNLEDLFENITITLKNIGDNILAGNINASPIKIGEDSCKYCNFKSICKYNDFYDKKRKIEKLSNSEVLKKIRGDNNA